MGSLTSASNYYDLQCRIREQNDLLGWGRSLMICQELWYPRDPASCEPGPNVFAWGQVTMQGPSHCDTCVRIKAHLKFIKTKSSTVVELHWQVPHHLAEEGTGLQPVHLSTQNR